MARESPSWRGPKSCEISNGLLEHRAAQFITRIDYGAISDRVGK
jgi:hypothetical protein